MEALAKSCHVRSSAPKLRIVAKHMKGVTANQALVTLHSLSLIHISEPTRPY